MQLISCNLCNSNNTELVYRINEISTVRCLRCGLMYQNPRFLLEGLYAEKFYLSRFKEERLLNQAHTLIKMIERYVPDKARVLEVGPGLGYTLKVAKDKGWQVFGIEISPFAIKYVKEEFGITLFNGNLKEAQFAEEYFDSVIMNHVLEHLPDPLEYLKTAFSILKNSGVLYIAVPNIQNIKARFEKEKWSCLKPEQHFYYFSPGTLKKMVMKAGFKIICVRTPQNIITADELSKTGITFISSLGAKLEKMKNRLPFIFKVIREFVGNFFPGEGIIMIAKK